MKLKNVFALILFLGAVAILRLPINAAPTEYNEDETVFENDYIPDELREYADTTDNIEIGGFINKIINQIFTGLKGNLKKYSSMLAITLVLNAAMFLIGIYANESRLKNALSFAFSVMLIFAILPSFLSVIRLIETNNKELAKLLGVLIPSFSGVFLAGGGTYSAVAVNASLTLLISVVEALFLKLLLPILLIGLCVFISERLSPVFREFSLLRSLTKQINGFTVFLFGTFVSLVSLSGALAAAKDGLGTRGIKFATANIVPILGASVSDAMKMVTGGAKLLRVNLGIVSAYGLLSLFIPLFTELFAFKIAIWISSIFSTTFSVNTAGEIESGFISLIDLLIAVTAALSITTFFIIIFFAKVSLNV